MNIYRAHQWAIAAIAVVAMPNAHAQDNHEDEHHLLDEIVVKATPLQRTVEQLAQPTSVLTGERLIKQQSTSLGETVSQELGLSSTFFGPVASRPVIRGQYGERVRILSNGLDSLDASALSEDHQTSVDSFLANSVEIVRGPATLLYGSGAAGGLVNVVDSRIAETPLDKGFTGGVAASGDSAVGRKDIAAKVDFGSENIAVHADYMRRETDDYEIPGFAESAILREMEEEDHDDGDGDGDHEEEEEQFGIVENSDSETESGAIGISFTSDNGYFGVSGSRFDSNYGIPGGHGHHEEHDDGDGDGDGDHAEEEEVVRIDMEQTRYELRSGYEFNGFIDAAEFLLASNDYTHTEFEGDEVGTVFETDGIDARLELTHAPIGNLVGAFGLQYRDIDFIAVGDEAYVPPSQTTEKSLFLFEEWTVNDSWVLQGSARWEQQSIDTVLALPSYSDDAFGASVGAIFSFGANQRIAANLASTQRHPNSTELYADGPHVAVQRYEIGSVTQGLGILSKEKSTNLDLTWRGETERTEWSVTAFINEIDDYINLSPTAAEIDEFQVYEYGQTDARLSGFEAEGRFEIADTDAGHFHTRLFADMVRGEDRNTGDNLPRIPPLRLGAGLHYVINSIEASIDATWHDEQTRNAPNELPTDSYVLVGADVSYALDQAGVFLFAKATNLTDEDARQHASPLKDTVPLPGRSLHLGVRWDF
ncbi:MAG: TonB-dependent receptor [Woeseiaceae bacterium]